MMMGKERVEIGGMMGMGLAAMRDGDRDGRGRGA